MESILKQIIEREQFTHYFQPIFDKNLNVVAYEALLRCEFTSNPELLFRMAISHDKIVDLDTASVRKAIKNYNDYFLNNERPKVISINIYSTTLVQPFFPHFLSNLMDGVAFPNNQVVLEINEDIPFGDIPKVRKTIKTLKDKGFKIALDDIGRGTSTGIRLIELETDFIKLDRYFSNNLANNIRKQCYIKGILNFLESGQYLVIEGVENQEDFEVARKLGISYFQGYYLGKPDALNNFEIKKIDSLNKW